MTFSEAHVLPFFCIQQNIPFRNTVPLQKGAFVSLSGMALPKPYRRRKGGWKERRFSDDTQLPWQVVNVEAVKYWRLNSALPHPSSDDEPITEGVPPAYSASQVGVPRYNDVEKQHWNMVPKQLEKKTCMHKSVKRL